MKLVTLLRPVAVLAIALSNDFQSSENNPVKDFESLVDSQERLGIDVFIDGKLKRFFQHPFPLAPNRCDPYSAQPSLKPFTSYQDYQRSEYDPVSSFDILGKKRRPLSGYIPFTRTIQTPEAHRETRINSSSVIAFNKAKIQSLPQEEHLKKRFQNAVLYQSAELVHLLLTESFVDLSWRYYNNSTALHIVIDKILHFVQSDNVEEEKERLNIARLLLRKDKDPYAIDNNGLTVLHKAIYAGHTTLIRLLCSFINVRNSEGKSALNIAAAKGDLQAIVLLIRAGASDKDQSCLASSKDEDTRRYILRQLGLPVSPTQNELELKEEAQTTKNLVQGTSLFQKKIQKTVPRKISQQFNKRIKPPKKIIIQNDSEKAQVIPQTSEPVHQPLSVLGQREPISQIVDRSRTPNIKEDSSPSPSQIAMPVLDTTKHVIQIDSINDTDKEFTDENTDVNLLTDQLQIAQEKVTRLEQILQQKDSEYAKTELEQAQ